MVVHVTSGLESVAVPTFTTTALISTSGHHCDGILSRPLDVDIKPCLQCAPLTKPLLKSCGELKPNSAEGSRLVTSHKLQNCDLHGGHKCAVGKQGSCKLPRPPKIQMMPQLYNSACKGAHGAATARWPMQRCNPCKSWHASDATAIELLVVVPWQTS